MGKTTIEWATAVWNPLRGCTRVSPGCVNCYAEVMAARFSGNDPRTGKPMWGSGVAEIVQKPAGGIDHRWTGKIIEVPERLADPLRWRAPQRIFVNSTSDLFHEGVSDAFLDQMFAVMALAKRHTFLILTKRTRRMQRYMASPDTPRNVNGEMMVMDAPPLAAGQWPLPNVWMGASVEDQQRFDERAPDLLMTPAHRRFFSYEPALGLVDFSRALFVGPEGGREYAHTPRNMVHQIIVGGESGPGSRDFHLEYARATVAICRRAGVAAFVKQMGAAPVLAGQRLKLIDKKGGDMAEWPEDLRVREMP